MQIAKKSVYGVLLIMFMVFCLLVFSDDANAVSETGRTDYSLMAGVKESTIYATTNQNCNVRIHLLRIDKDANVSLKVSTNTYYKKKSKKASRKKYAKKWNRKKWGYSKVATQAKKYNQIKDKAGTVIAGTNGDFFFEHTGNGMTRGYLIMEGNMIRKSKKEPFFAVLKSGKCVIRSGKQKTSDVVEAISGNMKLLNNGNITVGKGSDLQPREAIGITAEGDVIILSTDGREPASKGTTLYDTAQILQQQGCVDAINFDGGGSASFLTKRPGNKSLVFRNVPADSYIRNVSSSLLVVKNKKSNGKTVTGAQTVSMVNAQTGFVTENNVCSYLINGKKQTGFVMVNATPYLFDSNGNGMTTKVKIGKHVYSFKNGKYSGCSDKKAGSVGISYIGAGKGGRNMLSAYHYKDKVLNVGLNTIEPGNAKMRNWGLWDGSLPWYAYRNRIKTVNVGYGVQNIGTYFCYVTPVKGFEGSPAMKSKVSKVNLPSSLKKIGANAFYSSYNIKNLLIPKNVTSIKAGAFKGACKGYIRFTQSKPPKFGKNVFKGTKCKKIYVKKTSAWKKFVKKNKFKKYGFKGTVKYK